MEPMTRSSAVRLTLAPFWRRLAALLVDWLVIFSPLLLVLVKEELLRPPMPRSGLEEGLPALLVVLALVAVNDWMLVAIRGQSLGKILLGIAVVRRTGEHPDWGAAFIRSFIRFGVAGVLYCAGPVWLVIDGLWMLGNADRQTLHDICAGTFVCFVPHRTRRGE